MRSAININNIIVVTAIGVGFLCGCGGELVGPSGGRADGGGAGSGWADGAGVGRADGAQRTALASQQGLAHPGGLHTTAQIAFVRSKLAAGAEPWKSALVELKKLANGCQSHTPQAVQTLCVYGRYQQPELHFKSSRIISKDSACAYWSALAYKLTDKASYAKKALEIMNDWAQTNTKYRHDKECSDTALVGTYTGVGMILAAELLYHDPKWAASDRQSFLNWADNVYKKVVGVYYNDSKNKGCWSAFGTVAYWHLKGDVGKIQQVIPDIRKRIDKSILSSGEMRYETQRGSSGLWYSYFALAGLTAAMQLVYESTGTDLFQYQNKRVKKAVDYLLYYCDHPSKWPHYNKSNLLTCTQTTWFKPSLLFEAMWSIYGDPDYDSHVAPDRPIAYTNPHHVAWSMPTLMTARVKSGPGPGSIGEVGRVTVSQADGGQWHPVSFSHKYKNPVVVMGALSTHGGDPSTLRVKDVTATGFKFQIDEWDYLTPPGSHKPETVAWMVMEAGRHALAGGKVIEAGRTSTDGNWKKVSFSSSFGTAPVVFSQISTRNGGDAATTRQKDVHPGGFTVAVQEEEANGTTSKANGPHWPETISWVAISRGSATAGKRRFQAAKTKIDSTPSQMVFTQSFSTAPTLFAQMQTFNGWNPATTRYRSLSTGGAKVFIQEERSNDDELNHVIEGVGWLAIEPGTISAK